MDPAKNLRNVSISLSNSLDESFVRFVVDLGRALKIPVMAGGVETVAQKELLLSMGCKDSHLRLVNTQNTRQINGVLDNIYFFKQGGADI